LNYILNKIFLINRPIEISSKQRPRKLDQVPVHMRGKRKIIDPRFKEDFGDYDAKEFRQSYHFITDMRRQELKVKYLFIFYLNLFFDLI